MGETPGEYNWLIEIRNIREQDIKCKNLLIVDPIKGKTTFAIVKKKLPHYMRRPHKQFQKHTVNTGQSDLRGICSQYSGWDHPQKVKIQKAAFHAKWKLGMTRPYCSNNQKQWWLGTCDVINLLINHFSSAVFLSTNPLVHQKPSRHNSSHKKWNSDSAFAVPVRFSPLHRLSKSGSRYGRVWLWRGGT